MDIAGFLASVQSSHLATGIRDSLYLFPLIESFHVFGLTLVFGTIAIVDLRLLGIASIRRPFRRITSDIMKWTWAAFALTVTTGALMFTTNASVYYRNFFFRTKILLLVFMFLIIWASRYTKVGPNQVLVISGRKRRMMARAWGTVLIFAAAVLTIWSMVYYLRKALPEIRAKAR